MQLVASLAEMLDRSHIELADTKEDRAAKPLVASSSGETNEVTFHQLLNIFIKKKEKKTTMSNRILTFVIHLAHNQLLAIIFCFPSVY